MLAILNAAIESISAAVTTPCLCMMQNFEDQAVAAAAANSRSSRWSSRFRA